MTDKILEVRGLTKTYGGEKKPGAKQPTPTLDVLKGIDIDIYRGDVVCLIGPSGCGKSTFLRCLNRLEIPTSGSIKFEGTEVDEAHIDAVRQKMGMVFQHFNLFPHLTVKKNLSWPPPCSSSRTSRPSPTRPTNCWPAWVFPTRLTSTPRAFPAANSSASPLPAPWPWTRTSSSSMSLPAPSTPRWSVKCLS